MLCNWCGNQLAVINESSKIEPLSPLTVRVIDTKPWHTVCSGAGITFVLQLHTLLWTCIHLTLFSNCFIWRKTLLSFTVYTHFNVPSMWVIDCGCVVFSHPGVAEGFVSHVDVHQGTLFVVCGIMGDGHGPGYWITRADRPVTPPQAFCLRLTQGHIHRNCKVTVQKDKTTMLFSSLVDVVQSQLRLFIISWFLLLLGYVIVGKNL